MVRNELILTDVLSSLYQQRGASIRTCASEIGVSRSTVHTIARSVLKLRPYHLIEVQQLSDYDKLVRVEACRRLLDVTEDVRVIYTDECTFYTDGHVNSKNCIMWDYERPEGFFAETTQSAKSVTVWAGMTQNFLLGPYFFPATVTADAYQAILSEFFIPDLHQQGGHPTEVWFQQDGAPAHAAAGTLALLYSIFQHNMISRGCLNEWPPRSPDLSPCDFYLWGRAKDIVYKDGALGSLSQLEDGIIRAFHVIRQEKMGEINRAVQAVRGRMEKCVELQGAQLYDM